MEENNRKGPGVFYAVVGVATLVVAIIGATFAYFSAAATPDNNSDAIGGQTQNIKGTSLTIAVDRVEFTNVTAADEAMYDTLVPAWFGLADNSETDPKNATPAALTATQAKAMLSKGCESEGYTGCHLYKITASSDQDVAYANLRLNLAVDNHGDYDSAAYAVVDKSQWGYVVFTSSTPADQADTAGTGTQDAIAAGTSTNLAFLSNAGAPAAIGNGVSNMDIHHNQKLDAGKDVVYYLLVYVNDTNLVQNATTTTGEAPNLVTSGDVRYVVGSYNGSVELQAMGGKVRASFAS